MVEDRRGARGPGRRTRDEFTRVRRVRELARYDAETLYGILDAGATCVVAHVVDGRPVATPTLHWRIGARVYWHGSVASRMLRTNATGAEVCLTVYLMDGWVLARSAFNHTANYRCAMLFGRPEPVTEPQEKLRVLQAFSEHWFPGRWDTLRPVHKRELGATHVLSMPIEAASAKVRSGDPSEPVRDQAWPVWAGVVPFRHGLGAPVAATGLAPGLPKPRLVAPGRVRPTGGRRSRG